MASRHTSKSKSEEKPYPIQERINMALLCHYMTILSSRKFLETGYWKKAGVTGWNTSSVHWNYYARKNGRGCPKEHLCKTEICNNFGQIVLSSYQVTQLSENCHPLMSMCFFSLTKQFVFKEPDYGLTQNYSSLIQNFRLKTRHHSKTLRTAISEFLQKNLGMRCQKKISKFASSQQRKLAHSSTPCPKMNVWLLNFSLNSLIWMWSNLHEHDHSLLHWALLRSRGVLDHWYSWSNLKIWKLKWSARKFNIWLFHHKAQLLKCLLPTTFLPSQLVIANNDQVRFKSDITIFHKIIFTTMKMI